MLVLPIINNGRVLNVQIKLKNTTKVRQGVSFEDTKESDIIVNREKFSESSFANSKDDNAPLDFIKSRSMLYPRDFLVTTKEERDSTLYDVYKVPQPPKSVNRKLDKLYSKAINDLRNEIPNNTKNKYKPKGRCISFDELGLREQLTTDKLATLQRIVKKNDPSTWSKRFEEAEIEDIPDTLAFINNFECVILSNYTISEKELQNVLKLFSIINSREYRNLKKYYHTAKTNMDIFERIDIASRILYDKPLNIIHSYDKPKQYIKVKDEVYDGRKTA